MSIDIETEIKNLLKTKRYGLSIEDVSTLLKINRTTAAKYLLSLESKRSISVRFVGKAKLHYPLGIIK